MRIGRYVALLLTAAAVIVGLGTFAEAATGVAVFNFQMTTQTPDWKWLEKCLADQITTDLSRAPGLTLIARDKMQEVAERVKWAPEMATTDATRMGTVTRELAIEYLVTGVCSVKGDQLEITAQVVQVKGRQEVFRKTVSGEAKDVISVQKQVSAELYSWFTKTPVEQVLPLLPVWTRSIPAMKALYEGMHLYDQGRYHEAWLSFRGAERADAKYVEAVYWVGKMYYFMDRYEHARRGFEEFVYMDQAHPRIGDAIVEYLHTYEKRNTPPQELLAVYRDLRARFGNRMVTLASMEGPQPFGWWLDDRIAPLQAMFTPPPDKLDEPLEHEGLAFDAVHAFCNRTGKAPSFGVAQQLTSNTSNMCNKVFYYEMGPRGAVEKTAFSPRYIGQTGTRSTWRCCWIAPSGYVIKSIRIQPLTDMPDGTVKVYIHRDAVADSGSATGKLADVRRKPLLLDKLPHANFFVGLCTVEGTKVYQDTGEIIKDITCTLEFEPLGKVGSLFVDCAGTTEFRVDVDGRFWRTGAGWITLLKPGEHTLTFSPLKPDGPYTSATLKAKVEAGKGVSVIGSLPWKKDNAWGTWEPTAGIPSAPRAYLSGTSPGCTLLLEDGAIRLLWISGGDIWTSVSTDGKTFSSGRLIGLPVSSAWREYDVKCVRDESGRWAMMFRSNRNARHEDKMYVCWSRDFEHWTAPALVGIGFASSLMMDDHGRFLAVVGFGGIFASTDALSWKLIGSTPGLVANILQREDGIYETVTTKVTKSWRVVDDHGQAGTNRIVKIERHTSPDAVTWTLAEQIAEFQGAEAGASLLRDKHGSTVFCEAWDFALVQRPGECWKKVKPSIEFLSRPNAIFYAADWHPRWGTVIAWYSPLGPAGGPYVVRGPGLTVMPGEALAPPSAQPAAHGGPIEASGHGGPSEASGHGGPPPETPPPVVIAEGKVTIEPVVVPKLRPDNYPPFRLKVPQDFKAPASGTRLGPRVRVAECVAGPYTFHVALDYSQPDFKRPDVLRFDLSGKGKFTDAFAVPQTMVYGGTPLFWVERLEVKRAGGVFPVCFSGWYGNFNQLEDQILLGLRFSSKATGMCRFGEQVYRVEIQDENSNLLYGDRLQPAKGEKSIWGWEADAREPIRKGWLVSDTLNSSFLVWQLNDFSDRVAVLSADGRKTISLARGGSLVQVDGALYQITVTENGKNISAKLYAGKTGQVQIDADRWTSWFQSRTDLFQVTGGREPVTLPADEYVVKEFTVLGRGVGRPLPVTPPWAFPEKFGEAGPNQSILVSHRLVDGKPAPTVKVTDSQVTKAEIGAPFTAWLDVTPSEEDKVVGFEYRLKDKSGRFAMDWLGGAFAVGSVQIEIRDEKGQVLRTIPVAGLNMMQFWKYPASAKGKFTATLKGKPAEFPPQVEPATFELK